MVKCFIILAMTVLFENMAVLFENNSLYYFLVSANVARQYIAHPIQVSTGSEVR